MSLDELPIYILDKIFELLFFRSKLKLLKINKFFNTYIRHKRIQSIKDFVFSNNLVNIRSDSPENYPSTIKDFDIIIYIISTFKFRFINITFTDNGIIDLVTLENIIKNSISYIKIEFLTSDELINLTNSSYATDSLKDLLLFKFDYLKILINSNFEIIKYNKIYIGDETYIYNFITLNKSLQYFKKITLYYNSKPKDFELVNKLANTQVKVLIIKFNILNQLQFRYDHLQMVELDYYYPEWFNDLNFVNLNNRIEELTTELEATHFKLTFNYTRINQIEF